VATKKRAAAGVELGARIKRLREKAELTQDVVAQWFPATKGTGKKTQGSLSRWEAGTSAGPSLVAGAIDAVLRLAAAANADPFYALTGQAGREENNWEAAVWFARRCHLSETAIAEVEKRTGRAGESIPARDWFNAIVQQHDLLVSGTPRGRDR
jgi:transcriptional regulator with XRE-family HTH domain